MTDSKVVGEVAEIAVLAGFISFGFVECTGVYDPVFDGRHAYTVVIPCQPPVWRLVSNLNSFICPLRTAPAKGWREH